MFVYRQKASDPFIGTSVNIPANSAPLKYGFQWLRKQNDADAVVVDEKSNASLLEHLVFKYDLLTDHLSFFLQI